MSLYVVGVGPGEVHMSAPSRIEAALKFVSMRLEHADPLSLITLVRDESGEWRNKRAMQNILLSHARFVHVCSWGHEGLYKLTERSPKISSFHWIYNTRNARILCLGRFANILCSFVQYIIYIYAQHSRIIECIRNILESQHNILDSYALSGGPPI